MKIALSHPWVKTVAEAKVIQEQLKTQVITQDYLRKVNYVAGVDVGFKDNFQITQAAVAVLSFPQLELVEHAIAQIPTTFPYVPGYLSSRSTKVVQLPFSAGTASCLPINKDFATPIVGKSSNIPK